ncbi:MAG: hypothetical protein ABIT05_05650 [Chitinophagaceae bacterium]
MIKSVTLIILILLRIGYQSSDIGGITPFTSPLPVPQPAIPAKVLTINASISNNKVVLNWEVSQNETADQFEVEKSTDGKHFFLAALVFGTDKAENGSYQFYEKAGNQKIAYRIKVINKNRETEYSRVVEINPNV